MINHYLHYLLTFLMDIRWGLSLPQESIEDSHIPKKLDSVSYRELIDFWAAAMYPGRNVIVLTNVNLQAKNLQFWAKVPPVDAFHFVNDLVILICKDKTQMLTLLSNIGSDFADAYAYCEGSYITSNDESRSSA